MDKLLAVLLFLLAISVIFITYPVGPLAVLFGSVCALVVIFFINKNYDGENRSFLHRLFIVALMLRITLASITYSLGIEGFFGGDSITYDLAGQALYNSWFNLPQDVNLYYLSFATRASGSGWGMAYLVAAIYSIVGRNTLAVQIFNSVLGAATVCLIFSCAKEIFKNNRVAKVSAIFVACFPSMILWSSQALKDEIICFLLALAMNSLFSLQKKLNFFSILILLISLISIYTLRFYIFFAVAVAIFGSIFLNTQKSVVSIARQVIILIVITLGLTYFGVLRNAQSNLQTYGSLETLQNSRLDMAKSAESGFGQDIDVSTPTGAIQALPIGLAYLILAPFPWQVSNARQAITLPEVLFWWCLIPFLVIGVSFTIKNKLRESIAILLLTLLLTISYAIFQGNVGTAYRMRAQMQIFYFIFIAVGYSLWKEKRENQELLIKSQREKAWQSQMASKN